MELSDDDDVVIIEDDNDANAVDDQASLKALVDAIVSSRLGDARKAIEEKSVNARYFSAPIHRFRNPLLVYDLPYRSRFKYENPKYGQPSVGQVATPLEAAVAKRNVDMVRLLLDKGAAVTRHGEMWQNAVSNPYSAVIFKLLFNKFAESMRLIGKDPWYELDTMVYETPILCTIVTAGTAFMLQCAVDLGADVNADRTRHDKLPLEVLLRGWDEFTGYQGAYEEGDKIEKCRILLENGAKYDSVSSNKRHNILRVAVETDKSDSGELIRMLLETDMKTTVNYTEGTEERFGKPLAELARTPLTAVIMRNRGNHMEIIRTLFRAGARLTLPSNGQSPLSLAISQDMPELVNFILGHMTDVEKSQCVVNGSPVARAISLRRFETAVVLLEAGIECQNTDSVTGMTPLYTAVMEGITNRGPRHRTVVRRIIALILQRGVDMWVQCRDSPMNVIDLLHLHPQECLTYMGANLDRTLRAEASLQMQERHLAIAAMNHPVVGVNSRGRALPDDCIRLIASMYDDDVKS